VTTKLGQYIVTCRGVHVMKIRGSTVVQMIGFIGTLVTISLNYN
jgi:hypothetical protein